MRPGRKNYFSLVFGMTVQYKCRTWTRKAPMGHQFDVFVHSCYLQMNGRI